MGVQSDTTCVLSRKTFSEICSCVGAGLKKGANGEEGQEESEECATGIVLVEKLHIASVDMKSSCR